MSEQTKIVGLECKECGFKQVMKVDETDAKLQNKIGYVCPNMDGPTEWGCGEFRGHVVSHIYGEPAASKLRGLKY